MVSMDGHGNYNIYSRAYLIKKNNFWKLLIVSHPKDFLILAVEILQIHLNVHLEEFILILQKCSALISILTLVK